MHTTPSLDTLERLIPDEAQHDQITGGLTLALHLERYEFAAAHACGRRLLDIACGVGYGTRFLSDRVQGLELALGVDNSKQAIDYARRRYGNTQTQFTCADALGFHDMMGFDTIVSLETIEHLDDPRAFLAHVLKLLRPGGIFIGSAPTTLTTDVNPHHRHDFTRSSLRRLLCGFGLEEVGCLEQRQHVSLASVLSRSEIRLKGRRTNLLRFYLHEPGMLARRVWNTLCHGFEVHYLAVAMRRPGLNEGRE